VGARGRVPSTLCRISQLQKGAVGRSLARHPSPRRTVYASPPANDARTRATSSTPTRLICRRSRPTARLDHWFFTGTRSERHTVTFSADQKRPTCRSTDPTPSRTPILYPDGLSSFPAEPPPVAARTAARTTAGARDQPVPARPQARPSTGRPRSRATPRSRQRCLGDDRRLLCARRGPRRRPAPPPRSARRESGPARWPP
jgi:hypothetical protein